MQQMQMPDFPEFGSEFGFGLPPLPRLLPKWTQLQWVQSEVNSQPATTQIAWAPSAAAGAASGFGVAAIAAVAVGLVARRRKNRR